MTLGELEMLLDAHVPRWRGFARITSLGARDVTVVMPYREDHACAAGAIGAPALMALADRAAYYLTLALAGPILDAVTANLAIHFVARAHGEVTATATILRRGRRLAVSAVELRAGHQLVAHATVAYALPS